MQSIHVFDVLTIHRRVDNMLNMAVVIRDEIRENYLNWA